MAISFDLPERILQEREMLRMLAENVMRPHSRELDEHEHERPWPFVKTLWPFVRDLQQRSVEKWAKQARGEEDPKESGKDGKDKKPRTTNLRNIMFAEMLSWGDVGQYLCTPMAMLAGAAIEAVGTPEQKLKFLGRFAEGDEPKWGAMAMTEPGAGSDTSAIQTTAVFDAETNEWVLNGEKIFCTNGKLALEESNGVVVVWATVDRSAGRAGMKPFVVEAGTPGVKIGHVEKKHGIRASDTAAIVFDNARIPADNLLGSAEVRQRGGDAGFKGAMATFDASRPMVAASAIGVGRAAFEFTKDVLQKEGIEIPYGKPRHELTTIQRDVLEMEAQVKAAWLLTLRCTVMLDEGQHNSLEASMAKAKAGKAMVWVAQKCVELLGPMGYSRDWLVEKWLRDSKIGNIYEGTEQINLLIVARRILQYTSRDLQ